jgi:hypothetical protein
VLDDEVKDCCCLHLFDHLPWADEAAHSGRPPEMG